MLPGQSGVEEPTLLGRNHPSRINDSIRESLIDIRKPAKVKVSPHIVMDVHSDSPVQRKSVFGLRKLSMSKAPVSREERSKSAYKRKLSLSQIRHSEVDIGNVSVLRIREFLGPVLLLIPVLYNQFTVPFRIAFYYRAVTRESLAFFALDVVMDLWVWADILVRVRALVADYQKIKETASSVPISLRQKMATAFDILCAFPVDYIMRLASVRYISPYRLGRMFSMFSVPGRFTKLERIYEEFKGSSNTALWRMAHYTFYYI
eukprot:85466_1